MTQETTTSGIPEWTMADRLRKAREVTGMDQRQMAAELGVNRNTISNAETGARGVRRITLKAWALATGVPLEWLETGSISVTDGPGGGNGATTMLGRLPRLTAVTTLCPEQAAA